MKPSEAMLKGFAMAGGKQSIGVLYEGDSQKPIAVCAMGAICLAAYGSADYWSIEDAKICNDALRVFERVTGESMIDANNGWVEGQKHPMSIPDIAGILAAEGL